MPELPEVETIVRELRPKLIGKKFWSVQGLLTSTFRPSLDVLMHDLPGHKILDIQRRGKYIVFELDQKMNMIVHLRMSGRLLWKKPSQSEKHLRAIFNFSDGTSLYFVDTRKFGRIWLFHQRDFLKETGMWKLGIEPFDPDFSLKKFHKLFGQRRGILKNTLLRQDIIAGIGNIYADEICFRSRLHPSSRLETITPTDLKLLYESIRFCLEEGIRHNGASVSNFVGTRGTRGKQQHYLQVYGRKDDPCYVCLQPIQKTTAAGRGTFFCRKCQLKK